MKNYVKKGSKLYIEGALQTRKWLDSTGVEKYTTEIILQNYIGTLVMLDSKGKSGTESIGENANNATKNQFAHDDLDDEIPF